jgi:FlaA1/EpsC-like NDP-sugar epimerase
MPNKKLKIPVKCLRHQIIPTDKAASPVSAVGHAKQEAENTSEMPSTSNNSNRQSS